MGRHVAVEGLIAGTIGAATVAIWILWYDAAGAQPFRTPALLAAALFQGLRDTFHQRRVARWQRLLVSR